jgi:hypothetical protein
MCFSGWLFPYVFKIGRQAQETPRFGVSDYSIISWGNPCAVIGLHFIQLSLHYVQLTPKDTASYNADHYQSQGEQTNSARPPRHGNIGLTCLFFVAMAATVFMAFKSAEYADDRGAFWWWLPFLCFLGLAFWFAGHAISFTL